MKVLGALIGRINESNIIVNQLGYDSNYHLAQDVRTEIAELSLSNDGMCPISLNHYSNV